MPLTDIAARKAKPDTKPKKLADEKGLYLLIQPNGAKWWRWDYRFDGKRKTLSMGVYPESTLAEARERRDTARRLLAAGVDPSKAKQAASEARRAENEAAIALQANTFEAVAREWLGKQPLAAGTVSKAEWMLEDYVFPEIGKTHIAAVTAPAMLRMLKQIEEKGLHETAHRTKQRCSQIFRYAIASGLTALDPTAALKGALRPQVVKSHPALTDPVKIRGLLLSMDAYDGDVTTAAAMKLAALTFVRPGELRAAEWEEFDLEGEEPTWRIPAAKMKNGREHIVPLAPQAVAILRELHTLTKRGTYIFPSLRTKDRPMSENTVNAALRRMGYDKETMTGHGFRSMASTRLNEMGWMPDVIERQLAHSPSNKVRAVYNRASYLPERRQMMIAWATYLDELKAGNVAADTRKLAA